jgi:hypothetical protein
MSDGEKSPGMGAGKIVLIVVLVLFALGALCCAGAWFFGGRYAWQFGRASVALAQDVQTNCGASATMNFFPDDEGRMVLALGVPGELTPERIREIQDATWKSYAKAFAEGGFELHAVAVGTPGAGKGGVKGWKDNAATVADLVARTGVAAPPKAAWIEKIEAEQKANAEKQEQEDAPSPADGGKDAGGTPK